MALFNPKNFDIISGIIIITLSLLLFIYSAAAVVSILIIIAIIMVFLGLTQILNIRKNIHLEGTNIVINYLIAIIELFMGMILIISLIIDPIGTAIFSIRLVGFAIFLIGLSMLYVGSKNHKYRKEYRSILMVVGLLTIIFGVLILAIPSIGFNIVAIMVAFPLLFIGLIRLLKGILS